MGSGCSLGTDILEKVCTPEDIDNKIKNYFENNKFNRKKRRNKRNTGFLIDNYSDDENIDYDENEDNEDYNTYDDEYGDEYNENNILNENYNEFNKRSLNGTYKRRRSQNIYANRKINKHLNPIYNLDNTIEPLSLDIASNYKKMNKKLNNKNYELNLTKVLLKNKHCECNNLKTSLRCLATNCS